MKYAIILLALTTIPASAQYYTPSPYTPVPNPYQRQYTPAPTTYQNMGNFTYGSDGSTTQRMGNFSYTTSPDGRNQTCQTIGQETICN